MWVITSFQSEISPTLTPPLKRVYMYDWFWKNNKSSCILIFCNCFWFYWPTKCRNHFTIILKVHFKSRDTSKYNYSYLKHFIIIGRIKNGFLKKNILLEVIDSQEMSAFYKVYNFPVNSFKLINILNMKNLKSHPPHLLPHIHKQKKKKKAKKP